MTAGSVVEEIEKKRSDMKIVASIEARMTSTRLPGKVLKTVGHGKPLLKLLIERLRQSDYVDEIVVATTLNSSDDPVEELCRQSGVAFSRGSEEDVLGRVVGAVESVAGDIVVEITGDCPFMDPNVVDYVTEHFLKNYPKYDYVCNTGLGDLRNHIIPLGMDVQVFRFEDLKKIAQITDDPDDREHVSLYFYRDQKETYSLLNVEIPTRWRRDYPVRLTVDTAEDYLFIKTLYDYLTSEKDNFTLEDILKFCDSHPEIVEINSHVEQNKPAGFVQS